MRRRTKFGLFSLVTLGVMSGGVLMGLANGNGDVGALTYSTYQRVDFTFNPTVKVTLSSSDLTISNLAIGGSSDSNIIDITAETNVATGLSFSAMVSGANNKLERVGDTSQDKDSFTALDSNVATLAGFGTNTWGYSYCTATCDTTSNWVSGNSGSTSTGYNGLTISPGVTIASTSSPSSNTVQFKIGAKADMVQASGTYTNTIDFVAVSNVVTTSYTVTFNNGTGASNWPDTATGTTTSEANVKLWAGQTFTAAPSRLGYTFMGWCTASTNNDSCSGNVYQADETYPITSLAGVDGPVNINLYAMWGEVEVCNPSGTTIGTGNSTDIVCMQDISSSNKSAILTAMNAGTQYHLLDARDYQDYTVAKLADDKIWMTKNLNLAGGTTLTSDKTDFVNGYTIPTNQGWQANGTLPASAVKNSGDNNLTDSSQFSTDNYAYVYNSGNTTGCGASGQNIPCYSYYSWDVATLGSGRSISADNTDAPYSICPKGWKLPTSRTTAATNWQTESDFYVLAHQYGLDSTTSTLENDNGFYTQAGPGTVPNFLLAGTYYRGSFDGGGSSGYYWSSTSGSDSNYARYLYFNSSYVYSAYSNTRRLGLSVRCVAR